MTLIKICGITNIEDAIECVSLGAHMLGFVFADSPRQADVDTVRHICRIIGGDARTVGVFTDESEDVISIVNDCHLSHAQLHGGQSEDFARRLSSDRVIRVARVGQQGQTDSSQPKKPLALSRPDETGPYRSAVEERPSFDTPLSALRQAQDAQRLLRTSGVYGANNVDCLATDFPTAAYYLLDTYKKGVAGGTGEVFDWELAVRAKSMGKPVILSGGLSPDNVAEAIRAVRPFAVDVSSGVEASPGKKDLNKVKEFIANVRNADNRA